MMMNVNKNFKKITFYSLIVTCFFSLFHLQKGHTKDQFLKHVKNLTWKIGNEEIDVIWIENKEFPKFSLSVYFEEGALNDQVFGLTKTTMEQLLSGTKYSNQKELTEFFDFYGASVQNSVTHEYSVFSVEALTKDIDPIIGKVCEIFRESTFPTENIKSYVKRKQAYLNNLSSSHATLADRVFRKISLGETPYEHPVEGTRESLSHMTKQLLKKRLHRLNETKKTLFIAGPKDISKIQNVLKKQCPWSNKYTTKTRTMTKSKDQSKIYLIPVPEANQAQIRLGRYITPSEFKGKHHQLDFLASFLGGGFTSKLVQELRVKRGLTYSASAYISLQKDYGRAGLSTFSKNETVAKTLDVIRSVLNDITSNKMTEKEFNHQKNHAIGSFAFNFEKTDALLSHLMHLRHLGRDFSSFTNYPEEVEKMTSRKLARRNMEQFPWSKLTIVVVGDKSLADSLSQIRPVQVLDYHSFL